MLMSPLESGVRAVVGVNTSIVLSGLDIFCNYAKIDKVDCPTLIMHGTADAVVPCSNGRALFAKLRNPYPALWIDGCGHNNMPEGTCAAKVCEFLGSLAMLNRERERHPDIEWQATVASIAEGQQDARSSGGDEGVDLEFGWDYESSSGGLLGCTA
jgi:fermentation-respiration switch protein FrsA (DUF1100 family)